jgi:hypothetical protein
MPTDRVALLNTYMDAAIAAQAAGDYPTALNNALAAQGIIATLPKASRSQGPGGGEQSASWDVAGIDNFVRNLRKQQGAALGVQSVPITIVEPATLGDGEQFANSSGGYVQ